MISGRDFYNVMSAMVPLYVAMIVAYASVRWVKIFTPEQISGINRFVSTFAVPLLSFHFVSANNPYEMNFVFIGADTLQKIIIFVLLLAVWGIFFRKRASIFGSTPLEWVITIFALATLPNTLVMGIPLLVAMYGEDSGSRSLMVQVVVLQCIVWYTLLLFLFEFRGARVLIAENFPDTAAAIASIEVDSDVVSLDGYKEPLETESEVGSDGRLHIIIRRSSTRRSSAFTGAEIFSVNSPESKYNSTPRGSTVNYADQYGRFSVGTQSGFGSEYSSRPSNHIEDGFVSRRSKSVAGNYGYPGPNPELVMGGRRSKRSTGEKDVHMFNWNTIESPASEVGRLPVDERFRNATVGTKGILERKIKEGHQEREDMAFAGREVDEDGEGEEVAAVNQMPPTSVMTKLILIMVWRKLIRNPNTWTSIIGLIWSFIAFRWNITMPKIIADSISILSNTGLGMAMFSLGLFMAMQPKLIACGYKLALFSMAIRFIIGPAIAAVAAVACGLRGRLLRISIVQAALPQGIVPFVFAKEYNNHPAVLSTAVIFGMLVALPVDLLYFILLEL